MMKKTISQQKVVKCFDSSVLLWELLSREELTAFVFKEQTGRKLLYKEKNGFWIVKDFGDES